MRAFRLFSQEYEEDNVIKVSKVEEVLAEMDQMLVACGEHMEINVAELIVLLKSREKNGYVNYKEFIDEAFGSEN
jgi:Ca2+-binding EF-hand superfamily protein